MANFDFKKYLTRVVKYMIYLCVVLCIFIAIFSLTSGQKFSYDALFRPETRWQMVVFLLFFSFIYPFFGYIKKTAYISSTFEQDKHKILTVFENSNFVLVSQDEKTLVYRHKNKAIRLLRMCEDSIVVYISDNPLVLEGQRKDVYRLARAIEYATRRGDIE